MNVLQYFQEFSKSEIALGLAAIVTAILGLAGALEKLFGWKSVGTIFCSFIWTCCKGVWNWAHGAQLKVISEQLTVIQKEVTPNGGGSMKDVLNLLKSTNESNWTVIMGLHDFTKELGLRMDIADEAVNRMSFKLDAEKSCIYVSENFLRFFGYTPKDILGASWDVCIDEKYKARVHKGWKEAYNQRKPYRLEQIMIASNADRHLCLVRGIPLESQDGKLTFFGTIEILESLDE